jgi:hypothetical protein
MLAGEWPAVCMGPVNDGFPDPCSVSPGSGRLRLPPGQAFRDDRANPTKGAPVTGPEHYCKAEQLLEEAEADAEHGWRPYRQIQPA